MTIPQFLSPDMSNRSALQRKLRQLADHVDGIGAPGGISDGDKGDVTVSASGATWTVDLTAPTLAATKAALGLTGTNSGDQTSIVGITGTKAQFDTAVTDGNFLYVGDVTAYTDEMAQDAVGGMAGASLAYVDGTPLLARAALTGAITAAQDSNATSLGSFTLAELNAALSDADVSTGGGTATGTNTGDQTTISGNAGSATVLQTSRNFSISGGGITAAAVGFTGAAAVVLNASVDAGHITLARMANVATGTVFYRKTAGAGAPEVQTLATLKADLGLTGTNSGDQVSIVGITGTLAEFDAACTDANFLSVAAAAAAYQPLDAQLTDLAGLSYAGNSLKIVRVNAGETALELAAAGSGSGDFVGPASSTDNALVRFDGTGGKTGQDSNFLVNDAGVPAITSVTGLAGEIGAGIADYFTSTISLDASSTYEIECVAYFLKTTAGTVTFTWTFSSAPTVASSFFTGSAATGFTTANVNGTVIHGQAHRQANTTVAHAATGSLTTAVYHSYRFRVLVRTNAATTIQLRATESAGTITPQAGSYMRATKIL